MSEKKRFRLFHISLGKKMSSDLYRDYSQEILQRPLPKLEPPPEHLFHKEDLNPMPMATMVERQPPLSSSSSTTIHVHHQPSGFNGNVEDRKQLWRANVNSAISGN